MSDVCNQPVLDILYMICRSLNIYIHDSWDADPSSQSTEIQAMCGLGLENCPRRKRIGLPEMLRFSTPGDAIFWGVPNSFREEKHQK